LKLVIIEKIQKFRHRKNISLSIIIRITLIFIIIICIIPSSSEASSKVLKSVWYPWDPYLRIEANNENRKLTGLDVEIVKAVLQNAGYDIDFEEGIWVQGLNGVKDGTKDILIGALKTKERQEFAYYPEPYRKETQVLYVPKGTSSKYHFKDVNEMLEMFKSIHFRLGVTEGYAYGSEVVNAYVKNPANSNNILKSDSDRALFELLMENKIDGFIVDRLVGATTAWRNGWQSMVEEYPLALYSADIHLIFSKKTTSLAMVEEFNRGLQELKGKGDYRKIIIDYLFPVLLARTVQQDWFFAVDIIGTIAFAISGVVLAKKEKYDIFGGFVLSALPAFGGGVIRDMLVGRSPIGVLRTPIYIEVVFLTVIILYLIMKTFSFLGNKSDHKNQANGYGFSLANSLVSIFDALGLAAFTVIGVIVAIESRCSPLWIWGPVLAALTGAGGGIVRDIVRADSNIPSLKGSFYPEIALIWGLAFSLFIMWETTRLNPYEIFIGVLMTITGAFFTRIAVIYFKIKSPMF
jgi:polar amino acid transport system substrate-binding protein